MKKNIGKILLAIMPCLVLLLSFSCSSWKTEFMKARNLKKVEDYLYEIRYDDYDYKWANDYLKSKGATNTAGCSAVNYVDYVGRTYDWYFDDGAEFIVRTAAANGRYASLGVACGIAALTEDVVSSGKYNDMYKLVPFSVVDGINEKGVVCVINSVVTDDGTEKVATTGTNPGKEDLAMSMSVRYVLDYADRASKAVELLKERNIYTDPSLGYHYHMMIADKFDTFVVEFIGNEVKVLDNSAYIMTNFNLSDIMYSDTMGSERYEILSKNYSMGQNKRGMINLMKKVYYTQAYDTDMQPFWYSECMTKWGRFARSGSNVVVDKDAYYKAVKDYNFKFRKDKRVKTTQHDDAVLQTVHLSVYDMTNNSVTVIAQENNAEFTFALE